MPLYFDFVAKAQHNPLPEVVHAKVDQGHSRSKPICQGGKVEFPVQMVINKYDNFILTVDVVWYTNPASDPQWGGQIEEGEIISPAKTKIKLNLICGLLFLSFSLFIESIFLSLSNIIGVFIFISTFLITLIVLIIFFFLRKKT